MTTAASLYKSPVVFSECPHGYSLNGERLSGITSLIHDVLGLGVYPDASDYVMRVKIPEAGAYGSAVHHAIQQYDELGLELTTQREVWYERRAIAYGNGKATYVEDPDLDHADEFDVAAELATYKRHRQGFKPLANEYLVSDEVRYASNIDNVWQDAAGGIWLIDTKTNNLDYYPHGEAGLKEYLSWQLSIYAYLFERQNPTMKVVGLACNWLRHEDGHFWHIERQDDNVVAQLLSIPWHYDGFFVYDMLAAEELGFLPTAVTKKEKSPISIAADIVKTIADYLRDMEEKKHRLDVFKANLREQMQAAGIKSWDSGLFRATIANDSEVTSFDFARFKEDHPDLYDQYVKKTTRKGGFSIKLK